MILIRIGCRIYAYLCTIHVHSHTIHVHRLIAGIILRIALLSGAHTESLAQKGAIYADQAHTESQTQCCNLYIL